MDLTRWNDGSDAELEELVGHDLEMLELGRRVRAARPEPRIDPDFQRRLRAQLMTAAETQLRPRGLGRLLRPRASLFAYGAAGLGTAMIAAAALAYYAPHSDQFTVVQVASAINEHHSVNPDDVILISFNHEMDHRAVERGLTIQPATELTPTWKGTELILTPKHHLQANSPYVVTIPKNAARDVKGDVASKDIHITFGTRPVEALNPTGPPVGPVTLVGHDAGGVGDGSLLGFTGDGLLLATAGLVPPSPAASAGGSTPGAGGPDTPAPPVPALVRYGSDGPVRLGDQVAAVALSPAGHSLATLSPSSDGLHAVVAVSDTDGSHRSILSSSADTGSPLGWGGDSTHPVVLFASGGQLTSVDLQHHQQAVSALRLATDQAVRLAPGGRWAFVGATATAPTAGNPPPAAPPVPLDPSPPLIPGVRIGPGGDVAPGANSDTTNAVPFSAQNGARIVDLNPGSGAAAPPQLTGLGAGQIPSFSGPDVHRVGWVDSSGVQPLITVQPLDGSGPALHVPLPQPAAGDRITSLTLDATGERVAYALTHADGSGQLRVVRVSDGRLLATSSTVRQPSGLVFSPDGARLAYLQRGASQTVAELSEVPGAPTGGGTSVPRAAATAIDELVAAEVAGGRPTLDRLVAPAVETDLLSHLPGGLSRGYVISAVASGPDEVTAQIRLLRDPTNGHPTAAFTDQKVVLHHAGEVYVVSQSDIARPLHDEPSGPQVVHVETNRILRTTTVKITFDSDLDPSSVSDSLISLTGAPSGLAAPTVSYDPASRTVSVTFSRLRLPLGLTVGIGLRDVNGQGLASAFTTQVNPGR